MSIGRLVQFDRAGRTVQDAFFIYAAFAPLSNKETLVKVGISGVPLKRIFQIHCGSPFPIEAALYALAGSKRVALSAERSIHAKMAQYRTRGEWFQLRTDSAEHKQFFHATAKACFGRATGRKLEWKKKTLLQILETLGIDAYALAVKRKGG